METTSALVDLMDVDLGGGGAVGGGAVGGAVGGADPWTPVSTDPWTDTNLASPKDPWSSSSTKSAPRKLLLKLTFKVCKAP